MDVERELIGKLLAADPQKRISANAALGLKIFSSEGDIFLLDIKDMQTSAEPQLSKALETKPGKARAAKKMGSAFVEE